MVSEPLLEVRDLRVCYGKAEILKGVSLAVEEGSIVAILGANGAGKTTLLRTISGLKKPVGGSIRYRGRSIDHMAPDQIARLGVIHVPEGRQVFAPMSVEDNLLVGAFVQRDRGQTARDLDEMYALFPVLREKRRQLAGTLSGGQQQMLAVARALMARPHLILMDEPSLGLSPLLVAEIGRIIQRIHRAGTSVVLIEQNANLALRLAFRAYILEVGKITLEGDTRELACDPRVKECYLGG